MANPLFDLVKAAAKSATGTTIGKVTTTAFVIGVGAVSVKVYQDSRTGDIVGAERVETTVAKNDAQGDVRLKMEGLKDAPKDAEAEKAAAEAAARAAEEAAKAKEEEAAKLEEALKAQREAEEAAALAEQQAQEQDGENFADEEQNPDDLKDENADEGDSESTDAEAEADDDEKGSDTYKGDDVADEQQGEEGKGEEGKGEEGKGEVKEEGKGEEGKGEEDKGEVKEEGKGEEDKGEEDKGEVKEEGKGEEDKGEEDKGEEDKEGEDKEEVKEEEVKEEVKNENGGQTDETPTGVNNNNNDNNNVGDGKTPTVGSSFHNNNFGTVTQRSAMSVMDEARAQWEKRFEGASYQDGRVVVSLEDLKLLGAVPLGDWSEIATGADWVVSRAASYKNSTVRELVFEDVAGARSEVCKGIGQGINEIGSGDAPLRSGEQDFRIDAGFALTNSDIKTLKEYASMHGNDGAASHWRGIKVSFDNGMVRVYRESGQLSPKDKRGAKEARDLLLKWFRSQEICRCSVSDLQAIGNVGNQSAEEWAILMAATDKESVVKELVLDTKNLDGIGAGLSAVLWEGVEPKHGVFSVKLPFALTSDMQKKIRESGTFENAPSDYGLGFSGRRVFIRFEKTLLGELYERFEKATSSYADECEIAAIGLENVLTTALAPESHVTTLSLRDTHGQNGEFFVKGDKKFEELLASALRMPDINKSLRIRTNLRDASDLEERLKKGDDRVRDVWISNLSGDVMFTGRSVPVDARRVISSDWNACKPLISKYFEEETGDVSWNGIGDYLDKNHGPSSSSGGTVSNWCSYFEQTGFECNCILFAANPKSKIKTLTFGEVNPTTFVNYVKQVLSMDNIHEFDLYVSDAENLSKEVDAKFPQRLRKSELTYDKTSGMLKFRNRSVAKPTGVPAKAPGTGAATAVDEAKLEALEKEFGKAEPKEFEFWKEVDNQSFLIYGMPCIYSYQFFNDCDDKANGKSAADLLKRDRWIIDEIFDPTEAGFGKDDLVLKATCYYKSGRYADVARTPDTRNYFLHTWIKNWCNAADREEVLASTRIVCSKPDANSVVPMTSDFDGSPARVEYHKGGLLDAWFSPQNCIFKFESGASAWFISEFDPTDPKYNPNKLSFPNVTGKRRIAIHWTFVKDDDGHLFAEAERKATTGETILLPCQFSPNENERDTKPLLDFLRKQQEQKEKEREGTEEKKSTGFRVSEDDKSDNAFLKKIGEKGLREEDGAVLLDASEFDDGFVLRNFNGVVKAGFGNTKSRKILMKGFAEDTWKRLAARIVTGAVESINEPWELGIAGGKVIEEDEILRLGGVASGFQRDIITTSARDERKAPKYEDGTQSDFDRDFAQSEDTGKRVLWFRFGDRDAYAEQISFCRNEVADLDCDACSLLLRLRDDEYAKKPAGKKTDGGEGGFDLNTGGDPRLDTKVCIDDVETTFRDGVFDLFKSELTDKCDFDFKRVPMRYLPLAVQRGWEVEPIDDTCFRCYRGCDDYDERDQKVPAPFFVSGCVKVSGENGDCPVKTAVAADYEMRLTSFVLVPDGEKTYSVEVGEGVRREIKAKPGTVEAIDFEDSNMIDTKIRARLLFIRDTEEARNALKEARVLCSYDTLKNRAVWRSALKSRTERRRDEDFYGNAKRGIDIETVSDAVREIPAVLNDSSKGKYYLSAKLPEDVRAVVRYVFALRAANDGTCEAKWGSVDNDKKEAFGKELREFVRSFNETLRGDKLLRVNQDGDGIGGFSPFISTPGEVVESETLDWLEKKVAEAVKDAAARWIPWKKFVFKEGLKPSSDLVATLLSLYPKLSVVCESKPDWLETVSEEFKKSVQIKKVAGRGAVSYRFRSLQEIAQLGQLLETQIQDESGVFQYDSHMDSFLSYVVDRKVLSKESKVRYFDANYTDEVLLSFLKNPNMNEHFVGIRTKNACGDSVSKSYLCIKEGEVTTCYPGGIGWSAASLRSRIKRHEGDNPNDFCQFANKEIRDYVGVDDFVEEAIRIRNRQFVEMSWSCIADDEKDGLKQRLLRICIDGNPDDFVNTGIKIRYADNGEKNSVKKFLKKVEQYVNGKLPYSAKCKISLSNNGTGLTFVENDLPEETCDTPAEALLKGTASIPASSQDNDLKTKMDAYAKDASLLAKVGNLIRETDSDPVPEAIPYGGGDAVACREEIGRWCVALNCFAVVIDDEDTVSFYSPYCSGSGSYLARGLFMQGVSLEEAKKYFSQRMLEKAVVLKPTHGNRWCLLSSQARKLFVMRFKKESVVACPSFAPCGNTLEKMPALSASGAETGEFRMLTDEDKNAFKVYSLVSSRDLPNMAWMFNPRVMTERLIRAKREADETGSRNTYVLLCNPCKSFASDFLSSLQETKEVEGASDGRFWISVPENADMTVPANAYDFGGTTFVTEPVANPKGRRYLRFANDRELAVKNAKVTDVRGVERKNGCNWYRLREVLDAKRSEWHEEAKRADEEAKRDELKRAFEAGGEIEFTQELCDALGVENGLYGVIVEALKPDVPKVTKLKVSFDTYEECTKAILSFGNYMRNATDGSKNLQLEIVRINHIADVIDGTAAAPNAEARKNWSEFQSAKHGGFPEDPTWYMVHKYISQPGITGWLKGEYSAESKTGTVWFNADKRKAELESRELAEREKAAKALEEQRKKNEALDDLLINQNTLLQTLDAGVTFGEILSRDGIDNEFDATGVVDIERLTSLYDAIEGWLTEKNEVPQWSFVNVDLKSAQVWKKFAELSDKISDGAGDVFMHLDRLNGKIWFSDSVEVVNGMPKLQLTGCALDWNAKDAPDKPSLREWWWNNASLDKLERLTNALAELPGLKVVDFTELYKVNEGRIDAASSVRDSELHCYRTEDGLKELAKCSGVHFVLCCEKGTERATEITIEDTRLFDFGRIDEDVDMFRVSVDTKDRIVSDRNGTLLWNAYARELLTGQKVVDDATDFWKNRREALGDDVYGKAFGSFAEAIFNAISREGKDIEKISFKRESGNETDKAISGCVGSKFLWNVLRDNLNKCVGLVFHCPPEGSAAWHNEDGNDISGALRQKMRDEWGWSVEEFADCCDITVQEKVNGDGDGDDNNNGDGDGTGDHNNDEHGADGHNDGGGAGGGAGEDENDMGLDAFFNSAGPHAGAPGGVPPAGVPAGLAAGEVFSKEVGGVFDGFWMPRHREDPRVLELLQSLKDGNIRLGEFIGFVKEAKIDKLVLPISCLPDAMKNKVVAVFSNCPALTAMKVSGDASAMLGLVASYDDVGDFTLISRRTVRLQTQGGGSNMVILSKIDGNKTKYAFDNGCITCGDFIDAYKTFVNSGSVDKTKWICINLIQRNEKKNFFSGCSLSDFVQELLRMDVAQTGWWRVIVDLTFCDDEESLKSLVDIRYCSHDGTVSKTRDGNTAYLVLQKR